MYNPSRKVQSTQPCSGTTFRAHCEAEVEMVTPHTFREMVSVVWTGTVCTGLSNIASFFCFASHNQKRLKEAEVMENRERTKQHHNFVTLPRANETPILRLSCCHRSGSNSLFKIFRAHCEAEVEMVTPHTFRETVSVVWTGTVCTGLSNIASFFCFASHNQERLKQAEVMENREQTKQHHNFVTLPRANETPILRLSCCHPSGSNSLFETDGERGRERERERQREQP